MMTWTIIFQFKKRVNIILGNYSPILVCLHNQIPFIKQRIPISGYRLESYRVIRFLLFPRISLELNPINPIGKNYTKVKYMIPTI